MSTNVLDEIFAEKMEQRFTQGMTQGREEGERGLLRRYLTARFGTIPPALETRIAALDADGLAALFDRALAATTIETV